MDYAFGRELLPDQNQWSVSVADREVAARFSIADRGTRSERLDTTARATEARFRDPVIPSARHMYAVRLEPRNVIFESVLRKNEQAKMQLLAEEKRSPTSL